MPPKPKRLPPPTLSHLKHSRQLLEDFLYQYLPLLSGMGSISRLNLYCWFSSQWGLSADATQGLPFMILEALRLQRQHLLHQKLPIKPFSLTLLGPENDPGLGKAFPVLQEINNRSHTARLSSGNLDWQAQLKQLQLQLQQQPLAERSLMLLDPLGLSFQNLQDLLLLLPKKIDILLILPMQALELAAALPLKSTIPEEIQQLAKGLPQLLQAQEGEPQTTDHLIQQLRQELSKSSKRFVVHMLHPDATSPLLLLGISADALMAEKILQARHRLQELNAKQLQSGAQLGLFGAGMSEHAGGYSTPAALAFERLFSQEALWDNQALYKALLEQEIPIQEALKEMQRLIAAGRLEVLDEKKKKPADSTSLPISNTAYKLPAPTRYFRLKS